MLSRLILSATLVLACASGAVAQDGETQTVESMVAQIDNCLKGAGDDPDSCIQKTATECMNGPDGGTTFGSAGCLTAETEAWDVILNRNYAQALRAAEEKDRELADTYTADAASSLKTAQRAWITYRDAECERIYAFWKDGTIRTSLSASCQLDMTATRAIELAPDDL